MTLGSPEAMAQDDARLGRWLVVDRGSKPDPRASDTPNVLK
jgi:hypothetical protein